MNIKRRLLIAIPCKSGIPNYYMKLFEHLLRQGIEGWDIDYLVEASNHLLNISRNVMAAAAIKQGYEKVLFLDADHLVTIDHIKRILSHEVPIVSGLYCMKKPGTPFFLGVRAPGAVEDKNGLLEAHFLPTGFLLCSIEALRTIQAAHPEHEFYAQDDVLTPYPKVDKEVMMEFFPYGVNGPRTAQARLRRIKDLLEKLEDGYLDTFCDQVREACYDEQPPGFLLGEDYFMGFLAQLAGVKMFIDTKCMIQHEGKIFYPITDESFVATKCMPIPEHEGDCKTW